METAIQTKLFLFVFSLIITVSSQAQIGIGTTTPAASAQLDVTSTTKGVLIPRMASVSAVVAPAEGLLVYQTNAPVGFYVFKGGVWTIISTGTLTLTTTGTSGAATLVGNTLNIPQYQAALTNPVTGSGTTNFVPKWTPNGTTLGNSQIFDDGTNVGIGTNSPSVKLTVNGSVKILSDWLRVKNYADDAVYDHPVINVQNSRGTISAPTYLLSGDEVGAIAFREGTDNNNAGDGEGGAGFAVTASENWTSSALGSNIDFFTTPNGSILKTPFLWVQNTGIATFYKKVYEVTHPAYTIADSLALVDKQYSDSVDALKLNIANPTYTGVLKTPLTSGSIPFIGFNGELKQSNSTFFRDSATANIGIGTTTPLATLTIAKDGGDNTTGLRFTNSSNLLYGSIYNIPVGTGTTDGFYIQAQREDAPLQLGTATYPQTVTIKGGNVGIGITSPAASSILDVTSTSKGFLPPRMDSTQRNAIASPATGLTIYNTTINAFQVYNGTKWYSTVHFIGENYGGGIVFYVYDNGQHGLIAATADQNGGGLIRWYGGTFTNTRARADGVGAGLKNTVIIIANQGPVDGNAFAATVCNEYSVTVAGVTYGDWYLPSKYELNLLYLQKTVVGGFASAYYWSSSELDGNFAWAQHFGDGSQNSFGKNGGVTTSRVRAVRAF